MTMGSLDRNERAVLAALTDEFMSLSVVKIRAGLPSSSNIDVTVRACVELEKRGLAERIGSERRSASRWRLAASTGASLREAAE